MHSLVSVKRYLLLIRVVILFCIACSTFDLILFVVSVQAQLLVYQNHTLQWQAAGLELRRAISKLLFRTRWRSTLSAILLQELSPRKDRRVRLSCPCLCSSNLRLTELRYSSPRLRTFLLFLIMS